MGHIKEAAGFCTSLWKAEMVRNSQPLLFFRDNWCIFGPLHKNEQNIFQIFDWKNTCYAKEPTYSKAVQKSLFTFSFSEQALNIDRPSNELSFLRNLALSEKLLLPELQTRRPKTIGIAKSRPYFDQPPIPIFPNPKQWYSHIWRLGERNSKMYIITH